jgi:hypothetical protein
VPHAGVRGQRGAGFFAQARHDIQRPRWQARRLRDAGKGQRAEAGLFGRLEDARVAHRQCGAHAAADDLHRIVPGHDVRRHAMRLAQRECGVALGERDRLPQHLVGSAAIELQVARQCQRVGAALAQRLADIQRLQPRQLIGLLQHRGAHPQQHAAALGGAEGAPGALEGGLRRQHGGIHVGRVAARDGRQRAAVGRVDQRQRRAAGSAAPCATDEDLRGIEHDRGSHTAPGAA